MTVREIFDTGAAILFSIGGGGVIVFGLSGWLGKVWAERLMTKERTAHELELAEFRNRLERGNQEALTTIRRDAEIYREQFLKTHNDKIGTYGFALNTMSEFLADIDLIRHGLKQPTPDCFDSFNRARLKAHCHMAMLAPQNVLDAYNQCVGFILTVFSRKPLTFTNDDWAEIRRRAFDFINTVREDVGIDKSKVEYRESS